MALPGARENWAENATHGCGKRVARRRLPVRFRVGSTRSCVARVAVVGSRLGIAVFSRCAPSPLSVALPPIQRTACRRLADAARRGGSRIRHQLKLRRRASPEPTPGVRLGLLCSGFTLREQGRTPPCPKPDSPVFRICVSFGMAVGRGSFSFCARKRKNGRPTASRGATAHVGPAFARRRAKLQAPHRPPGVGRGRASGTRYLPEQGFGGVCAPKSLFGEPRRSPNSDLGEHAPLSRSSGSKLAGMAYGPSCAEDWASRSVARAVRITARAWGSESEALTRGWCVEGFGPARRRAAGRRRCSGRQSGKERGLLPRRGAGMR